MSTVSLAPAELTKRAKALTARLAARPETTARFASTLLAISLESTTRQGNGAVILGQLLSLLGDPLNTHPLRGA